MLLIGDGWSERLLLMAADQLRQVTRITPLPRQGNLPDGGS
jgi:hypothetical protein